MSQTISHTEVLQVRADELWEAVKQADTLMRANMPEFFAKSEYVQGNGEPGSIRVIILGSGFAPPRLSESWFLNPVNALPRRHESSMVGLVSRSHLRQSG